MTPPLAPDDDEDLWFLTPLSAGDEQQAPFGRAAVTPPALAEWRAAQGDLAAELAQLAARFGALDERLRRGPEGWRQRLALAEAAEISWWAGDRVPADTLALWVGQRLSGAQDDGPALARAGWAARRLTGGPGPLPGLAGFLARAGDEAGPRSADWQSAMEQADDLHPVVQAAFGHQLWSLAGVSGESRAAAVEAPVVAARIAAGAGRGSAVFLPLALAGAGALRAQGEPSDRLSHWLSGAEQSVLAALALLDRIEGWSHRAEAALAGQSGRTPPRLVRLFADWPFSVSTHGGKGDRRQPCCRSAQSEPDDRPRVDPRGHRARPVPALGSRHRSAKAGLRRRSGQKRAKVRNLCCHQSRISSQFHIQAQQGLGG